MIKASEAKAIKEKVIKEREARLEEATYKYVETVLSDKIKRSSEEGCSGISINTRQEGISYQLVVKILKENGYDLSAHSYVVEIYW